MQAVVRMLPVAACCLLQHAVQGLEGTLCVSPVCTVGVVLFRDNCGADCGSRVSGKPLMPDTIFSKFGGKEQGEILRCLQPDLEETMHCYRRPQDQSYCC